MKKAARESVLTISRVWHRRHKNMNIKNRYSFIDPSEDVFHVDYIFIVYTCFLAHSNRGYHNVCNVFVEIFPVILVFSTFSGLIFLPSPSFLCLYRLHFAMNINLQLPPIF